MASIDFFKERSLRFLGKDFRSNKRDLIKYSQAHFSGTLQDLNEASPTMAVLELQAGIADGLSFYMDQLFLELKQETAREIANVASFAKSKGYKPQGKAASRIIQSFVVQVPSTTLRGVQVPDDHYAPNLKKGAKVQGPNGVFFESLEDLNFATSSLEFPRQVTGSQVDSVTGLPTHFAIRREVECISGETKTETFSIGDFRAFQTIELANADVLEVIEVTDSDNNQWYEVDYLAQDTVFDSSVNANTDSDLVPFVLKLLPVPRRFIVDRDVTTNKSTIIFGSGDGINFDDELVPNLADLALPLAGRRIFTSYSLDPQNFLKTRSLGLSPHNTTITVKYRVGGGNQTIVPPKSVDTVVEAVLEFSTTNLDALKRADVANSIQTLNQSRSDGGGNEESIGEIKANSDAYFAAQNRCVTPEDYIVRALSLPAKFGKLYKVYVKKTHNRVNINSIDLHVLSKDSDGHLSQATATLKENLKNYIKRFSGLGVGVNLLDTDIINLKMEFGVVISPKFNRSEVLAKCLSVSRDFLQIDKMQIGEPIVISELMAELQAVQGVISVYSLRFKNIFCEQNDGKGYSTVRFDIKSNLVNNILLCPPNACFEIKHPSLNLVGESR